MSGFILNSYIFGGGAAPPSGGYSHENDTYGTAGDLDSISINVSTWGIQRGDYLIGFITGDNNNHVGEGFTGFYSLDFCGLAEPFSALQAKRCTGSETTIVAAGSNVDSHCYCLIHVRGVKPIKRNHVTWWDNTTGMPDPPPCKDGGNACALLIFGSLDDDAITATAPAGFTLIAATNNTGTYTSSIMVAIDESPSAGQDPAVFGGAGTDLHRAFTLSLFEYVEPDTITGLKLWLDGSDPDTLFTDAGVTNVTTDGDSVYQWNDKSGQNNHLTQATAGNRPTYQTLERGGDIFVQDLSVVRFDGANDYMETGNLDYDALIGAQAAHVFAVIQQDSAKTQNVLFYHGSGATNKFEVRATDTDVIEFNLPNETGGALTVAQPSAWDDNLHLLECSRSSGDMEIKSEDTSLATTAAATGSASYTAQPFRLGANISGTDDFDGDICELLIFNTQLSAADQAAVVAYLKAKWSAPTGTFDPTHIPGCSLWLDADDTTTLFTDNPGTTNVTADAQTVSQWMDKANNWNVHRYNFSGDAPVYKTAIHNSKDCLRFDGTNHRLWVRYGYYAHLHDLQGGEVFMVYSADTASVTDYAFCFGESSSLLFCVGHTSTALYCKHGNNTLNPSHPTGYTGNLHIFDFWRSGADMELLMDDVSQATSAAASGDNNWDTGYQGVGCSYAGGNEFDGDICEIIVFKSKLSTADRARVMSYLSSKWGVTI